MDEISPQGGICLAQAHFLKFMRDRDTVTEQKPIVLKKGPYLLLFNHTTNLDPLMMALSFKGPVYFVANDDPL